MAEITAANVGKLREMTGVGMMECKKALVEAQGNIEAAVGAATWPVGAQVWNGHMPANTAKPRNRTGNAHNCSANG